MQSHPLRVRGLKLPTIPNRYTPSVASFTGAWIETIKMILKLCSHETSHPLRVRGLKLRLTMLIRRLRRRILYGCVD